MISAKMKVLLILMASVLIAAPASACIAYDYQKFLLHGKSDETLSSRKLIGFGMTRSEGEWKRFNPNKQESQSRAKSVPPPRETHSIKFQVIRSQNFPSLEGKEIWVRYTETSCGPYPSKGQTGYLVGSILETDEQGLPLVVSARTQSYQDQLRFLEQR